ncbi:hypothetical protein J3R83DRAFT_4950 [Lanmaoa asiatica]|nr:hypothetical protein J3R83DRAFT_4950 [Lanmaoa asiatica]
MTTTSQTYPSNSFIPTSTVASSSSTPTDDPGDPISDLFSSNGSPPLIVAFLAIGLFVVAMIGVFGWRRLMRSRGLVNQPIIPNRRRKSISLGKKPMLWDMWADTNVPEKSPTEVTRWENITPMAVISSFSIPSVQPPPVEPLSPPIRSRDSGGGMFYRMLQSLLFAVKRFYFPGPPPPPPPSQPVEKEVVSSTSHALDEIEWGDASSLQVSVIITLPTQRRCGSGTSGEDTDPEGMELGEFCIGMMDVPWTEGG